MCSPGNMGVDVSTPNTAGSSSILQNLENGKYQGGRVTTPLDIFYLNITPRSIALNISILVIRKKNNKCIF